MAEQTELMAGGEQQVRPQATPGQNKVTAPAPTSSTPDEDRDEFIRNALPVAAALRKRGKPEEAKQLEQVAQAIWQTKSMQPTQQPGTPAPAQEVAVKDLLASVYQAIDQDPALKSMPEAKALRRASEKLDQDGMLNITIRNGVVVSFISNFTDNFSRTKQVGKSAPEAKPTAAQQAPAPRAVATPAPVAAPADDPNVKVATIRLTFNTPEEPGRGMPDVLSKRFQEAGARVEVLSTKPALVAGQSVSELKVSYRLDTPGIEQVSALLDAAAVLRGSKVQEMPGDPQARKEAAGQEQERLAQPASKGKLAITDAEGNVVKPQVGPAQQNAPMPAVTVAQATPRQQPIPSKGEVIYAAAPPMPDGIIRKEMLSSQAAHYSLFQIQIDPQDTNRAILLPAPGKDDMLVNALKDTIGSVYQVSGQPEIGKRNLAVQTPTQLARTADGWRITEKGLVGFSAAETVYQAPESAPVQQAASPVVAQGKAFSVADLPVDLLAKVGVPVAELERTGQLQKLLAGQKTDLIPNLLLAGPDGQPTKFAAKLVLDRDAQGVSTLRVDLPKHELVIPPQVMGKEITPAMQQQLKTTGVVPLAEGFRDGQGQPFAGYLAVDQEMKRVVAVRPEGLSVPQQVYGVTLSPEQRKSILEGKPARIEGMTHPGEKRLVDAMVHLDPLARKLVFRDTRPRPEQAQKVTPVQEPTRRRGVQL